MRLKNSILCSLILYVPMFTGHGLFYSYLAMRLKNVILCSPSTDPMFTCSHVHCSWSVLQVLDNAFEVFSDSVETESTRLEGSRTQETRRTCKCCRQGNRVIGTSFTPSDCACSFVG